MKTFITIFLLLLPTTLWADVPVPGELPNGIRERTSLASRTGDDLRQCVGTNDVPLGISGIRHDFNIVDCLQIPSGSGSSIQFEIGSFYRSGPLEMGEQFRLTERQWPDGDHAAQVNYTGPSMHWCGPGAFMVSYNGPKNEFGCLNLPAGPFGQAPLSVLVVDGPAQWVPNQMTIRNYRRPAGAGGQESGQMHGCPEGYVLVGMHFDANIFLCGLVYPK